MKPMKRQESTQLFVDLQTFYGQITMELFPELAPATCAYFVKLVDAGGLDATDFYRIATPYNQEIMRSPAISIVQGGRPVPADRENVNAFDYIPHENTSVTGLTHTKYALSMPRFQSGQVYGSFCVCMRNEPCLDYGGSRHPDGLGFAVFGRVYWGQEILERIFAAADPNTEFPKEAVKIISAKSRSVCQI